MQMLGLVSPAIAEQPEARSAAEPTVLPTLFGEGYGLHATRPSTFVLSFLVHILAMMCC